MVFMPANGILQTGNNCMGHEQILKLDPSFLHSKNALNLSQIEHSWNVYMTPSVLELK